MKNLVLGCEYIIEHDLDFVQDVVRYLRKYLVDGVPPEKVAKRFERAEFGKLKDGFGETEDELWVDVLGGAMYALSDLYTKTGGNKDAGFVVIDDNSYISVIVVLGNPGVTKIQEALMAYKEPHYIDVCGDFHWPDTLEEGSPIEFMHFHGDVDITLHGGQIVEIKS